LAAVKASAAGNALMNLPSFPPWGTMAMPFMERIESSAWTASLRVSGVCVLMLIFVAGSALARKHRAAGQVLIHIEDLQHVGILKLDHAGGDDVVLGVGAGVGRRNAGIGSGATWPATFGFP
jgi:hypothetical protein